MTALPEGFLGTDVRLLSLEDSGPLKLDDVNQAHISRIQRYIQGDHASNSHVGQFNPTEGMIFLSKEHIMCFGVFTKNTENTQWSFHHLFPNQLEDEIITDKPEKNIIFIFSQESAYTSWDKKKDLEEIYQLNSLQHIFKLAEKRRDLHILEVRLLPGDGSFHITFGAGEITVWQIIEQSKLVPIRRVTFTELRNLIVR